MRLLKKALKWVFGGVVLFAVGYFVFSLIVRLNRANKLAGEPEFYNTLVNTCTTSIVRHVNEIALRKVPRSLKVLMPAYSDELAYKLGLLDTSGKGGGTLTLEEMRNRYLINDRAEKFKDDPKFSEKIRSL